MSDDQIFALFVKTSFVATVATIGLVPFTAQIEGYAMDVGGVVSILLVALMFVSVGVYFATSVGVSFLFWGYVILPYIWYVTIRERDFVEMSYPVLLTLQLFAFIEMIYFGGL